MSEAERAGAAQPVDPLHTPLEDLRRAGAADFDPARFRFLEALSRRMEGQAGAVHAFLQAKLHAAVSEYAARMDPANAAGEAATVRPRAIAVTTSAAASRLAQLNESIRAARVEARAEDEGPPDELASVRRFRRTWTSLRIQDQVEEAVARKPANAGPLNSHVLVLQSLDLMRELSPQYLERFLAHVETLQWLERAAQKAAEPTGKPAKAVRRKTPKS